ncbi:interleukin-8-like [Anguilla rostrata]|uniref:interleukin-8-like n=1 Tax=Anguilla rostrata TaxID=7938 RepID=UPI0030CF2D33
MALRISRIFTVLLLCGMIFAAEHTAEATSVRERCECVQTVDSVHWRRIADFTVTREGPLCKYTQIVLTLKDKKETCLNPDAKQGKRLQTCWRRIRENPAGKRRCLRLKRRGAKRRSRTFGPAGNAHRLHT